MLRTNMQLTLNPPNVHNITLLFLV